MRNIDWTTILIIGMTWGAITVMFVVDKLIP